MPEEQEIEIEARRAGAGQRFELSATGDQRRWGVIQWAAKPRASRGEFAPWWYREHHTWHLYREVPEVPRGEAPPPPIASFAELADVKAHIRSLVAALRPESG